MAVETWENFVTKGGICSACHRELVERESYYATLHEKQEGFERRDFCEGCWSDSYRDAAFSFWKAKIPVKEQKRKLFVNNEVLLQIFKRLAGSEDATKQAFTFVLALIVMRKRLLRYISTETTDGKEVWVVKLTGEDAELRIVNPHLTEEQLEQIREQLAEVLAGD
ncbi:MAG: hypothetical protein GXY33_08375 [Phycisphaerae bacterium]|nr:hypothetical protein [Phycisphaerae bacterium]